MSDFGLMFNLYRKDGHNITQKEYRDIENKVTSVFYDLDLNNFTGEAFHPQAVESINDEGIKGISFIISEYWDDDQEMQEDETEEILDYDDTQIGDIIDKLESMYEEKYTHDYFRGHW